MQKAYRKRLANHLRSLRGKQTLAVFARQVGISESTLHRLEMGQQNIGLDALEQICTHLHCEIGDLFPPLEERGR